MSFKGVILGDKPSSIVDAVHSTKGVFSLIILHAAPKDLHLYSVHGLFGSSVHLLQSPAGVPAGGHLLPGHRWA